MKTPNTKHQTPTNPQIPNLKGNMDVPRTLLVFEVWKLFGVWCLVFGVWSTGVPS
jgi:hypothetical protein